MKLISVVSLLIGNISASLLKGQCVVPGQEGAPIVFQNLDVQKILGDWFVVFYDDDVAQGYEPQCIKLRLTLVPPEVP